MNFSDRKGPAQGVNDLRWQLSTATATPRGRASRRMFFFDVSRLNEVAGVRPVFAPVKKGRVTFESAPSHLANISMFCTSIVRLDDGTLRSYHSGFSPDHARVGVCVVESADGLTWRMREVGELRPGEREANQIVIEGLDANRMGGAQVLRLGDGRWRMYVWDYRLGSVLRVAESDDGLAWSMPDPQRVIANDVTLQKQIPWSPDFFGYSPETDPKVSSEMVEEIWRRKARRCNDAAAFSINPTTGLYEYYNQWLLPPHPQRMNDRDNIRIGLRVIQRRVSEDGLEWSDPEIVLHPDANDSSYLQFYNMAVQYHEDWLIGFVGNYEVDKQHADCALAFSRDGRSWNRPVRGAFIPREPEDPAMCDAGGIYAASAWIDCGDRWLAIYQPSSLRHDELAANKKPKAPARPMAATWSKHRFMGLKAGTEPGVFLTEPFAPTGTPITLDADLSGELRVELCDTFGRVIPDFEMSASQAMTGDSSAHALRWRDGEEARRLRYDFVRVRFSYRQGVVYGIGF